MADAVRVWSSSGSNDLETTANWGGTLPVVGDSAVFPKGNEHGVATNLDAFEFKLKELITRRGYTGNIGSNGNPIITSASRVTLLGSGDVYYEDKATTDTDFIVVDLASPEHTVRISGDKSVDVLVLRGHVEIDGVVNNLRVGYHSNPTGDANVTVESVATITKIIQSGGMVDCSAAVARWAMSGGMAKQQVAAVTELDLLGGRMIYNHSALTSVDIHKGGILDTSQLTKQLTIGTAFIHDKRGLIYPVGSDLVVITNKYDVDFGDN